MSNIFVILHAAGRVALENKKRATKKIRLWSRLKTPCRRRQYSHIIKIRNQDNSVLGRSSRQSIDTTVQQPYYTEKHASKKLALTARTGHSNLTEIVVRV